MSKLLRGDFPIPATAWTDDGQFDPARQAMTANAIGAMHLWHRNPPSKSQGDRDKVRP